MVTVLWNGDRSNVGPHPPYPLCFLSCSCGPNGSLPSKFLNKETDWEQSCSPGRQVLDATWHQSSQVANRLSEILLHISFWSDWHPFQPLGRVQWYQPQSQAPCKGKYCLHRCQSFTELGPFFRYKSPGHSNFSSSSNSQQGPEEGAPPEASE